MKISGWREIKENDSKSTEHLSWFDRPVLNLKTWLEIPSIQPSAIMFRRSALLKIGGFNAEIYPFEFLGLALRLTNNDYSFEWMKRVIVACRRHDKKLWNTLESRVDALEKLWRIFFQNENLSTEIKRLEEKTRFDSLIWLAIRFYYTGNLEMMKKTLLESLNHTKLSVRGALIYWLCKFFRIAREEVKDFDASDLMSSKEWQELEELEFGKPEKSSVLKVQNKEIAGRKQLASAAAGSNLEITTKINFQTESSSDYVPKINLKPTWTRFVGKHRSGWKFALQSLLPLHTDGGIYFDGGCDRTFDTKNQMVQTDLTKGWIGLFHNPPNMPEWFAPTQTQKAILESKIFRNALEHCYGIFCLSRTHQDWLAKQIDVPIVALLHPTETPENKFSPQQADGVLKQAKLSVFL